MLLSFVATALQQRHDKPEEQKDAHCKSERKGKQEHQQGGLRMEDAERIAGRRGLAQYNAVKAHQLLQPRWDERFGRA